MTGVQTCALPILIHATHELLRKGLDVELWIAGEGDARNDLKMLIDYIDVQGGLKEGFRGRMKLLGYRADVIELYEAMDMYVLSSLREGLPNVVLEAMAMEVPVAATRIAGVPRVIEDGHNGLLVAPGSVEELTTAILRMSHEKELRGRLAQQGRRTIEDRYSFARRMQKIAAIYDELLC